MILAAALYLMLTIKPAPTFVAPIKLTVPGQAQPVEINVTFHCLDRDALKAWVDQAGQYGGDEEYLGRVIVGWSGIGDEHGVPLPYSVEQLAVLIKGYPAAGNEIFTQYLTALTESRVKN